MAYIDTKIAFPFQSYKRFFLYIAFLCLCVYGKKYVSIRDRIRHQIEVSAARIVSSSGILLASQSMFIEPSIAAKIEQDADTLALLDNNIIQNRINFKDYKVFRPGKENGDIFYPSWFEGTWNTSSTLKVLDAPLGEKVFGGEAAYKTALADFNFTLVYLSRFKALQNGFVLNDRLYNVEEIAKASIGPRCVIDDTQQSSDLATQIHLIISPPLSNGMLYDIDLYCTDRLQRQRTLDTFDTLERTSQSLGFRRSDPPPPPPYRKLIETVTLYTLLDDNTITAKQRTATYLSQLDPRYSALEVINPAIATQPIDVRTYFLTFHKVMELM